MTQLEAARKKIMLKAAQRNFRLLIVSSATIFNKRFKANKISKKTSSKKKYKKNGNES